MHIQINSGLPVHGIDEAASSLEHTGYLVVLKNEFKLESQYQSCPRKTDDWLHRGSRQGFYRFQNRTIPRGSRNDRVIQVARPDDCVHGTPFILCEV